MSHSTVDLLSRGNFIFLRPDAGEIRKALPGADDLLPAPQKIFLEDESSPPLNGFPILVTKSLKRLDDLLMDYLAAEEENQIANAVRGSFDSRAYATRLQAYQATLLPVLENTAVASLSYDYGSVFWLRHSLAVARYLQGAPRRVRQNDASVGREHGDIIKYKVLARWLDRVTTMTSDLAKQLATEMHEDEEALFPPVLSLMRDNILVLSEDYISPDLTELSSFFRGYLDQDFKEFRRRLTALEQWHASTIGRDPVLRAAATELLGCDPDNEEPNRILFRPSYVNFLSRHPGYRNDFLSAEQLELLNSLLRRLRTFEILHALRKLLVPLTEEDSKLVCRDRSFNSTWVGGPPVLELSKGTRPIDFSAPWVVNPVVHRFGLVYDITEFSATISMLGRVEKTAIETAFRMTAQFQRQIDKVAADLGLRLEKYLGDGAFYSGRRSLRILAMAIHVQRIYPNFVTRGFPFDKGMRLALNFGEYRLLPLDSEERSRAPRYEYFGHGLVELSRLSTGKKTQEIDTFRTYLVSRGYPESAVNKFFAPMMRKAAELVSRIDEARPFYAYINPNDTLINEGIVATEPFIQHLGSFESLRYTREHGRGFIVVPVESHSGDLIVGIRKLGKARFKGLEPMVIYEIVDGQGWNLDQMKVVPPQPLAQALERLFTQTMAASQTR